MQFHLDGFTPGDPHVAPAAPDVPAHTDGVPPQVDVLIVGCGPAGLTLAAQLAAFPDIRTCIVEQKDGPLQLGQADGIACRTMEMFEAFNFAERVLKEACWINEVTFWKPDERQPDRIVRHGRVQDTEDGLSEFPHVVLNQARVHDFYLELMRQSPSRLEPHYARRVLDLAVDDAAALAAIVKDERRHPTGDGRGLIVALEAQLRALGGGAAVEERVAITHEIAAAWEKLGDIAAASAAFERVLWWAPGDATAIDRLLKLRTKVGAAGAPLLDRAGLELGDGSPERVELLRAHGRLVREEDRRWSGLLRRGHEGAPEALAALAEREQATAPAAAVVDAAAAAEAGAADGEPPDTSPPVAAPSRLSWPGRSEKI